MLCKLEYGVEHLQIIDCHIAALAGQKWFNSLVLCSRDFHPHSIDQLVFTRPGWSYNPPERYSFGVGTRPVRNLQNDQALNFDLLA